MIPLGLSIILTVAERREILSTVTNPRQRFELYLANLSDQRTRF